MNCWYCILTFRRDIGNYLFVQDVQLKLREQLIFKDVTFKDVPFICYVFLILKHFLIKKK